ncbi:MAG: hypothetical protein ABS95_01895 [Verrucomicrobia bacterium SCN 57-15]|nr:MAG: hypothetical protein ABS95_01895 [Verrucomicrobia bacterium SCN 57-15]
MSKQILLNQAALEFRGEFGLPDNITGELEKRLQRTDWNELLKPILRGIPAKIYVVDTTGPERTAGKKPKPRKSRRKGTFCVEITRIGFASHTFEIPDVTAEAAERIALGQAGGHEFSEKHSEYEVQSVRCKHS